MNPVFTFGFKLAELTKQNEAASGALIGVAIKDAGKDPKEMGYQDYKMVFQTHLSRRLEKMDAVDHEKIVGQMIQYLGQQQFLFTMAVY
jgi:hypothetical protein